MRKFNDFNSAFKWTSDLIVATTRRALGIISEQVYKDSEKYTYKDSETMYKSGALFSQFEKGTVVLRTPYVRVRYYKGGRGSRNKMAVPQWFEITKTENIAKYKKQYSKIFNEVKK